ncbi:MAG: hypothetical protein JXR84_12310 [Anaerolineae bacterium]|nr:hypothetical protein [Anaerolineae bacterium]
MTDVVIQAENLGKHDTTGHQTERGRDVALHDVLVQNARGFWRTTADLLRGLYEYAGVYPRAPRRVCTCAAQP